MRWLRQAQWSEEICGLKDAFKSQLLGKLHANQGRHCERESPILKDKERPEIQIHGSSNLIQTLLSHDLIDEFYVWTFPLTVGRGKQTFGWSGSIPAGLKLLDCKVSKTGVIIATYSRDGMIKTGSVALEVPTEAEIERRKRLKEEK